MLKVTMKDLLNSRPALQRLAQDNGLPFRVRLALVHVLREVNPALDQFGLEQKKLREEIEAAKGGNVEPHPTKMAEINRRMEPVLEEEITIAVERISIDDLEQCKLSPVELDSLGGWLIDIQPPRQAKKKQ